ncbi:MAG: DNA-binding response regulator [Spirochaetaceae bacterium]|nr:MAG: DNA-binding response regulator [Spirochaetaceae bacterium]
MAERVLIVEDEPELNAMIRDFLASHGYSPICVHDGAAAVRSVFEDPPDIVVLDLNLPGLAGLDVARAITSQTSIPIIVTTARGEEDDRITGFLSGVDDYLVKPVSLPELALRIAAILRRTRSTTAGRTARREPIRVGDLRIDPERREVYVGERSVDLTSAQFSLLWRLASSPGRVFTRGELLEAMQGDTVEGYDRTIDVHIKNIRKRIGDSARGTARIVTVRGVGYRLEDR